MQLLHVLSQLSVLLHLDLVELLQVVGLPGQTSLLGLVSCRMVQGEEASKAGWTG